MMSPMIDQPGLGLLLLSFDGGHQYCLSQLLILREVIHRLHYDLGTEILPCEYFHLIAGVEMGGLIALLLVVFRMTVEDAIEEYIFISNSVYAPGVRDGSRRNTILRRQLESLLKRKSLPLDTKLVGSTSEPPPCKMFLSACTQHATAPHSLRNYTSRRDFFSNITIVDALLATCAFSPVCLGIGHGKKTFINPTCIINNPTREVIAEAYDVFGNRAGIACLLSLAARSRVQGPVPQVDSGPKWIEYMASIKGEQIADECDRQLAALGLYFRFSVTSEAISSVRICENWAGMLKSAAALYLEGVNVTKAVDRCVFALENKPELATLEQIRHSKGAGLVVLGLPKLSEHFIMREEPWSAMKKLLIDDSDAMKEFSQRIMVISGMGGSGKTQLARKFARDFQSRYQFICFVDGSSSERVKADLIAYVFSLGLEQSRMDLRQALAWFVKTTGWLIVFDNVDEEFDLLQFFPKCDHGSILITTRNISLGNSFPKNHYQLGVMSDHEAVEALLSAAFPADSVPSPVDRKYALDIVSELGCLPVAVVQAGSFILQRKCLPEYLDRLRHNRAKILDQAAPNQLDGYRRSTYAVLETTRPHLSEKTQKLLHLLSYFHHYSIPLSMLLTASQRPFSS
ncbi:hypothetical protein M408DRAFT_316618, partial [Serendipita vermifera MAFF 305830]